MSSALPVPRFVRVVQTYTLHNGTPKAITAKWASRSFTIPACDALGTEPARYANGQPIPGTLVLGDGWTLNAEGHVPQGGPPNWLASEAIRNILGIDAETGEAIGDYARAGISFLPENPSPELVAQVAEDGRRRYVESMRGWARETIAGYESAHEKAKMAGVDAKPFGRDYAEAVSILKQEDADNRGQVSVPVAPEADVDGDVEFLVFAKAKALELANKGAKNMDVNREALAEELLQDEGVMTYLRKNYRISKIGETKPAK